MNRDAEGLLAWLGDTELTDDQFEQLARCAEAINEKYTPEDDAQGEANAALSAALQQILGETSLATLGDALLRARIAANEAMAALVGGILAANEAGESQAQIARETGVTRMTVRAALGLS